MRKTLVLLLLSTAAFADEAPLRSAFGPGEQSTYVMSYLGVPAGEFQLTVGLLMQRDNRDVWPILCAAKSSIPVYTIDDKYVSYWDPRARENVGSDFWIFESKKHRREHVKMMRAEKKAVVKSGVDGEQLHDVTYDISPETLDVPGATLWLRNIPLKVGTTYERPVFTGAVAFTMKAAVEDKVKIQTAKGEREVFKVRVSTEFAGQLKQKRDLIAYLSADALQVPVRVEMDFLLGMIQAELVAYEAGRDFHG